MKHIPRFIFSTYVWISCLQRDFSETSNLNYTQPAANSWKYIVRCRSPIIFKSMKAESSVGSCLASSQHSISIYPINELHDVCLVSPQMLSIFLRQGLSPCRIWAPICLYLNSAGITHTCHYIYCFVAVLGMEPKSLCLRDNHFTDWHDLDNDSVLASGLPEKLVQNAWFWLGIELSGRMLA